MVEDTNEGEGEDADEEAAMRWKTQNMESALDNLKNKNRNLMSLVYGADKPSASTHVSAGDSEDDDDDDFFKVIRN